MAESFYRSEVKRTMEYLALDERVIFLGQTVEYPGSRFTYGTLKDISEKKRIELPIMEEVQMGISTGLALEGYIPVSIYPRCDFVLLAANQLVNHLDKMAAMSNGQFNPKVIIKTVIGSKTPIHPGPQHSQDYTEAFRKMLTNVDVYRIDEAEKIFPTYKNALESNRSSLIIEVGEKHH